MKVCGATESILINNLIMSAVIDMRHYILRQKLLHKLYKIKEVSGTVSHKSIVRKNLIITYIHVYILPYMYFHWSKMITLLGSLLQCIGQKFYTNFIQIVIFLYIIEFLFLCFNNCLS